LISKRLEIANQIKHDIKNVQEDVEYRNKKLLREALQHSAGNSLLTAASSDNASGNMPLSRRITTPMLCGKNPLNRVKFIRVETDLNHFVRNC
jgi:hypothetical protein